MAQEIKIAFVGDVMLGRLVNEILNDKDPTYPWGTTLPILLDADVRICNLECVISDIGHPVLKIFQFRSDEKNVDVLKSAKIQFVSLANNHVLDYGESALLRMLEVLDKNEILHAGAGNNLKQASQAAICNIKGKKIGLIAFSDNEPDWEAKENKPGIFYVPIKIKDKRAQYLFNRIKNVRQEVDFLIISTHWGPNWGYYPPQEHIPFAHALIDAGADMIFGHSGHVFRGMELYQKRPIIYCAGDFIDDYAIDEREKNDESFIFLLESNLKLDLFPICIEDFQANLAKGQRQQAILSKMKSLCQLFGTPIKCLSDRATLEI